MRRNGSKRIERYDDDDGHVIARMNVAGMPWHMPGPADRDAGSDGFAMASRRETLAIMLASMKWAFIGSGIMALAITLFVWLLTLVWS